jgi:ATP-binding cassette subfamily F protein 3
MRSKDVLKEALMEFDGTIIVVSHDREFLDGLVTKVYEFGNQRIKEHLGGIYDFLERKKIDNLRELERNTAITAGMAESHEQSASPKLSYEAMKEQNRALKRIEKAIAEAERQIERLETEIAALEELLATSDGASDISLFGKHEELKRELARVMDVWGERTMEKENL